MFMQAVEFPTFVHQSIHKLGALPDKVLDGGAGKKLLTQGIVDPPEYLSYGLEGRWRAPILRGIKGNV